MKKTKFIPFAALATAFLISSLGSAHAQLATWDFTIPDFTADNTYVTPNTTNNGNPGLTSDQAATYTAPDVTAGNLSAALAGNPYQSGLGYGNNNGNFEDALTVFSGATANTLAGSISANDYFTFTVTPAVGKILNLSGITVQVGSYLPDSSLSSYVLASPTGFTSSKSLGSGAIGTLDNTYDVDARDYKPYTVDLTSGNSTAGSSFQGLTDPTQFRVYLTETAYQTVGIQSISLFGSVASIIVPVPEPSQYGLLLVALYALFCLSRRYRSTRACTVRP